LRFRGLCGWLLCGAGKGVHSEEGTNGSGMGSRFG